MVQDDLQKEIRELRAQIEALRTALSDVTRPYAELMEYVDRLQDASRGYFRILDLYAKYGKVSPDRWATRPVFHMSHDGVTRVFGKNFL